MRKASASESSAWADGHISYMQIFDYKGVHSKALIRNVTL